MAKGRALAWKELRVGILVIASAVLLAVAVFFIGGDSGFYTPKYTITVYFQSANGLHAGAAVLLDGVTIGNVESVTLAAEAGPDRQVQAKLRLDKRYHDLIRSNAIVTIGTVGLLGDQEVELTRGTTDNPPVEDGGMLQGTEVGDIKKIMSGTSQLVANLNGLSDSVGSLAKKLDRGEGTVGMLLNDKSLYKKFSATADEATALVTDIRTGRGTIGKLISDDQLYNHVETTVNRLNSTLTKFETMVDKINQGEGTLGKMVKDPSLFDNANKMILKFGPIADKIDHGEGTLGKLVNDDKLYANATSLMNRADKLISTAENGQGTIGKLMQDPTLYNSINQTSSELQKLMYDFRQNPKKYLTINFRLF